MPQPSVRLDQADLFLKLASTNLGSDYAVAAYAVPGESRFRFDTSLAEGTAYAAGGKFIWDYERLEIWLQGKLLFAVPTLALDAIRKEDFATSSKAIDWLHTIELHCHMLLLNGERQANDQDDAAAQNVTTLALQLLFQQTHSGPTVSGKIGTSSFAAVPLSQLPNVLSGKTGVKFKEELGGSGHTAGPLLARAFSNAPFPAGTTSELDIVWLSDQQTLGLVYHPSSVPGEATGRPIPLPIVPADDPSVAKENTPFVLPVTVPGQAAYRPYALMQQPSDTWFKRQPIKGDVAEEWKITLDAPGFEDLWNGAVQQYKHSLRSVRPANRLTMLPEIEPIPPAGNPFTVRATFLVRRVNVDDNPSVVNFSTLDNDLQIDDFRIAPLGTVACTLRFDLGGRANPVSSFGASLEPSRSLRYQASIRAVSSQPFHTFQFEADLGSQLNADEKPIELDAYGRPAVADTVQVRIGSLDLAFGGLAPSSGTEAKDVCIFELQNPDARWNQVPRLTGNLWLPVDAVLPGGQDGFPSAEYVPENYSTLQDVTEQCMESRFNGAPPVVVPIVTNTNRPNTSFLIEIVESNPQSYSQTVELKLHHRDQIVGPAMPAPTTKPRVVVIDSDPFLVAAVDYVPLTPSGTSDVVAIWNTGDNNMGDDSERAWQLLTSAQPFTLTLPPQILGEEMSKATELDGKDGASTQPLDFRLGAALPQSLEPSYTPQNFTEAPWNLRRILGYPGQRDAGAGIVELNYELLYGLSCSVDTPLLRLAEMMSLLGRIPGRIPLYDFTGKDTLIPVSGAPPALPSALYKKRRWNWSLDAELYSKRVALLEPRAAGSAYGNALGSNGASAMPEAFSITQAVSCTFRGPADLRYSVAANATGSTPDDVFPLVPSGLSGGVSWPFESPRLFHATVRNPNSSSASVSGLMLSPLGASGTAKAGFDKDLSTITAVANIGRNSKVSVTRLGRIGVFHNLARYVIEYERDVSVSDQFQGEQTAFARRPVLRKTREYVEILEPLGVLSATTQSSPGSGCVKSIEFKERIIPVTSSWSSNVSDNGWKVPLWYQPDSVPQPGKYTYTRPPVVFNMAGADGADVECAVLTVDKLCFYTRTDSDADADPHNWPIVSGIDFLPVPAPAPNPAFTSSSIHETPAYDPPAPFGLSSFTHQIAPGHGRINLVNGRSTQAIGAVLSNVTLQRGLQAGTRQEPAVQTGLQQVRDLVRGDLFSAVRGPINPDTLTKMKGLSDAVCAQTQQWTQQVNAQVNNLASAVTGQETALLQRWVNEANNEIDTAADELNAQMLRIDGIVGYTALQAHDKITAAVLVEIHGLRDRLNALPASANALSQFAAKVYEQVLHLTGSLKTYHDDLSQKLSGLKASAATDSSDLQAQLDNFTALFSTPLQNTGLLLTTVRSQIQSRAESWMPGAVLVCHFWEDKIAPSLAAIQTVLTQAQAAVAYAKSGADDQIAAADLAVQAAINDAQSKVDLLIFPDPNNAAQQKFWSSLKTYAAYATALPSYITQWLDETSKTLQAKVDDWVTHATTDITAKIVQQDLDPLSAAICAQLRSYCFDLTKSPLLDLQNTITADAKDVSGLLTANVTDFGQDACNCVTDFQNKLATALSNELESARRTLEDALSRAAETIAQALPPVDVQLPSGAAVGVMLQHAFGAAPEIPNLGFSVPNAAYFFDSLDPHVSLTPLLTMVQGLVPNLSPLSTSVPTFGLFDRALPVPHLPNFDLSNIFPDFAGLKLTNLFPALKMPPGSSDAVKVTHGTDIQARTAWVQADIDLKTDTATIFSVGPMALQIVSPHFTSQVRAQAGGSGEVSKQATGAITGDWQLVIGGSPMITLASTALTFDKDGKLHVNVSPDRVQLSAALSFVQQIISLYSSPDNGFGIYPSATGIETRLSLPIPDTSLGTTGITNLNFNFLFGLNWADDFSLYAGFGLASPNAPFNIAVYILGGGGYLTATAHYVPGKALTCAVDMGMDASAALAISLGPISGSVHVNLGMRFVFNSGQGDLALGFYLLIGGEVSVLSIVSASILLRLDAMYQNGSFMCRGLFQIEIKICWCFTLKVSQEVSCQIGSGSGFGYNDPPALPWSNPSDNAYTLDAASFSSVPTLQELGQYPGFADLYLQLIS